MKCASRQVITVSCSPGMDSDWLMGERGNQKGKVPITYLELLNWDPSAFLLSFPSCVRPPWAHIYNTFSGTPPPSLSPAQLPFSHLHSNGASVQTNLSGTESVWVTREWKHLSSLTGRYNRLHPPPLESMCHIISQKLWGFCCCLHRVLDGDKELLKKKKKCLFYFVLIIFECAAIPTVSKVLLEKNYASGPTAEWRPSVWTVSCCFSPHLIIGFI